MPDKGQTNRLCLCRDRISLQYFNYGTLSKVEFTCNLNHINSTSLNCKRNTKSIFFPKAGMSIFSFPYHELTALL